MYPVRGELAVRAMSLATTVAILGYTFAKTKGRSIASFLPKRNKNTNVDTSTSPAVLPSQRQTRNIGNIFAIVLLGCVFSLLRDVLTIAYLCQSFNLTVSSDNVVPGSVMKLSYAIGWFMFGSYFLFYAGHVATKRRFVVQRSDRLVSGKACTNILDWALIIGLFVLCILVWGVTLSDAESLKGDVGPYPDFFSALGEDQLGFITLFVLNVWMILVCLYHFLGLLAKISGARTNGTQKMIEYRGLARYSIQSIPLVVIVTALVVFAQFRSMFIGSWDETLATFYFPWILFVVAETIGINISYLLMVTTSANMEGVGGR